MTVIANLLERAYDLLPIETSLPGGLTIVVSNVEINQPITRRANRFQRISFFDVDVKCIKHYANIAINLIS